jgi:hypothetical protein
VIAGASLAGAKAAEALHRAPGSGTVGI